VLYLLYHCIVPENTRSDSEDMEGMVKISKALCASVNNPSNRFLHQRIMSGISHTVDPARYLLFNSAICESVGHYVNSEASSPMVELVCYEANPTFLHYCLRSVGLEKGL